MKQSQNLLLQEVSNRKILSFELFFSTRIFSIFKVVLKQLFVYKVPVLVNGGICCADIFAPCSSMYVMVDRQDNT